MATREGKGKVEVGLRPFTKHNIEVLKNLVSVCFPITYDDRFYERCHTSYTELSRYAVVKDLIVGAVAARVEKTEEEGFFVHIMILLVYEKYRRFGIAHKLMTFLEETLALAEIPLKYMELHVQKSNMAAVSFYKKEDFLIVEELPNYYDIDDGDAILMRKAVVRQGVPVALGDGQARSEETAGEVAALPAWLAAPITSKAAISTDCA